MANVKITGIKYTMLMVVKKFSEKDKALKIYFLYNSDRCSFILQLPPCFQNEHGF